MILVNRIPQNEEKGVHCIMYNLVPDPDLQGEGGGGRGGGTDSRKFFSRPSDLNLG